MKSVVICGSREVLFREVITSPEELVKKLQ
jgi:hypothetical protein